MGARLMVVPRMGNAIRADAIIADVDEGRGGESFQKSTGSNNAGTDSKKENINDTGSRTRSQRGDGPCPRSELLALAGPRFLLCALPAT